MNYINFVVRETRITLIEIVVIQSFIATYYFHYHKDIEDAISMRFPLQSKKIIKVLHIILSFNALTCTMLGMIVII